MKTFFGSMLVFALSLKFISCNPYVANPDNWPNIYLEATLNKEQLVYKIGDTLKLIVTVPDSLPSLTNQGEKVKVHNINEAYLRFEFNEIDTVNKTSILLNNQMELFTERGIIEINKERNGHKATFNNIEKPFGVTINMVFKKSGFYIFNTSQAQKFIANNGGYKAGVLYRLSVGDNHYNLLAKHFKNQDGSPIAQSPFINYVFYVK